MKAIKKLGIILALVTMGTALVGCNDSKKVSNDSAMSEDIKREEAILYGIEEDGIYRTSMEGGESVKLYDLEGVSRYQVMEVQGEHKVYICRDETLYEGDSEGTELKQIGQAGLFHFNWYAITDKVTGEPWFVHKDYYDQAKFISQDGSEILNPKTPCLRNVIVMDGQFMFDAHGTSEEEPANPLLVEISTYSYDKNEKEEVIIGEAANPKEGNYTMLQGAVGHEAYYISIYPNEGIGRIYEYDTQKETSRLITSVELSSYAFMTLKVDEDYIYAYDYIGDGDTTLDVFDRKTGEPINNQTEPESTYRQFIDEAGYKYVLQMNEDAPDTIIKSKKGEADRVILEAEGADNIYYIH